MKNKKKNKKPRPNFSIPQRHPYFLILPFIGALLAAGLLYQSLSYGFTNFDDPQLLVNNDIVKTFDVNRMFSEFVYKDYLPLTFLTYAIEYSFFKMDAFWYHLDNSLLHLINILLVFFFISLLTRRNYYLSGVGAFLFAIFPTQPESVVWISERKDVLSTFFLLLVYICYLLRQKESVSPKKAALYYGGSLVFLLLSLFAKASGVTTAFILLLFDYYQERTFTKKLLIEKIPHLLIGIVFVLIHVVGHEVSGEQATTSFNPFYRLYLGVESLLFYISRSVFPYNMSPYYEEISFEKPLLLYLLGLTVLCVLAYCSGEKKHSKKEIVLGVGFFILMVLPILNIVPLRGSLIYADRYLYLAGVGLFIAYASIVRVWLQNGSMAKRALLSFALVALGGYYIFMFNDRVQIWQTSFTLWSDIVESNPRTVTGHMQLAHAYLDSNQLDQAVQHAEKGYQNNPENLSVNYSLALMYFNHGQVDKSLKHVDFVLTRQSQHPRGLSLKALVLKRQGKDREAQSLMNQALSLNPGDAMIQKHAQVLKTL